MSGIVGVWFGDGRPADPETVGRMADTLVHRGPDGGSVWCEGSVGLGHRVLLTAPEPARERLPLVDCSRGLAITADARIDNREELTGLLGLDSGGDPPLSDARLILAAYERWGRECASRLLGDFAFAIWDGRKRRLFCARDPVGVKPFVYCLAPDASFCFASEIKALLQLRHVPRRLDDLRVADFLVSTPQDEEYTFYRDVRRLPAGHWMVVEDGRKQLGRYWSLDPSRDVRLGSDEAYAEAFLEIFTEAVRCRLRRAAPVSAMLSGGLDSSSIVCVARELLRSAGDVQLTTFSTVFEESHECDESDYIREVIGTGGCSPELVAFDHAHHRPISVLREIADVLDQPVFAPNVAQPWQLYHVIRKRGARVVLDGHGGDETVSQGYGFLMELARSRRWWALAREVRGLSEGPLSYLGLLQSYVAFGLDPVIRQSRPLRTVRGAWRAGRRRASALARPAGGAHAVKPTLLASSLGHRVDAPARYSGRTGRGAGFRSERDHHWQTVSGPAQPVALEILDATSSVFSLELRFPFLDRRLMEFCLGVPGEQKRGSGFGRMILRRSMGGILPEKVRWRRGKVNFFPNIAAGLRQNETAEIRALRRSADLLGDIVDGATLRAICDRAVSGVLTPREYYDLSRISALYYWMTSSNGPGL